MGAVGIPIAKTVFEHLPVMDSETWEDQDLLIGSVRRPKKAKKKKKKCTNCVCAICCALSICARTKHNILLRRGCCLWKMQTWVTCIVARI